MIHGLVSFILIHMSKSKTLQILITVSEERLLKTAAKKKGLPLAEWARNLLRQKAREDLGPQPKSVEEALRSLLSINAPVDSVDVMIQESFKGRYR
ncbi:MAG: hypothetical protein C5B49_02825 [Bdellovibrio sp.]|nr:MAG: hypothetical protein C5B49_02825 [Bdellovibrio sp.]